MFKVQLAKSHAIALLSEVTRRDSSGRPSRVDTGRYVVELNWRGRTVTTTCNCRGSSRGMCYHSMGAVILSLEELDCHVAMSPCKGNLVLLQRTGGQLFTIVNDYTGGKVYALAKSMSNKAVIDSQLAQVDQVDLPGELVEMMM